MMSRVLIRTLIFLLITVSSPFSSEVLDRPVTSFSYGFCFQPGQSTSSVKVFSGDVTAAGFQMRKSIPLVDTTYSSLTNSIVVDTLYVQQVIDTIYSAARNKIVVDTLVGAVEYEVFTRVFWLMSDFSFNEEIPKFKSEGVGLISRSYFDFWSGYMELGAVLWTVSNSSGNNETVSSFLAGLGATRGRFSYSISGHFFPNKDAPDMTMLTLNLSMVLKK